MDNTLSLHANAIPGVKVNPDTDTKVDYLHLKKKTLPTEPNGVPRITVIGHTRTPIGQ